MNPPEPPTLRNRLLATFDQRLSAILLDLIPTLLLYGTLNLLLSITARLAGFPLQLPLFAELLLKLYLPALAYNLLLVRLLSATAGKRLLGISVMRTDDSRPGLARALPGERLADPSADISLQPPWMAAEDGPVEALARITAARLGAFRGAHPAQHREGGEDPVTFAAAAADLRAAAPRLAWNLVRRARWEADAEPWLKPALSVIEEALAARDAAALMAAAPDTDAETAAAIAALPAKFTERLTLDMVLDAGSAGRILIGSLPDDGAVYIFVLCRLESDACALGRFVLASVLE